MLFAILLGTGVLVGAAGARVPQTAPEAQQAPAAPDPQPADAGGKEHPEIPDTEGTTCVQCHEDLGKKKVVHGAVSAGMCTSCHAFSGAADQMRVALAGGVTPETMAPVCVTCHEDVEGATKAAHAHPALADGNCLTCHQPHESEEAHLLSAPTSELCVTCHDTIGADLQRKTAHPPVAAACGACHDPHGSARETLLREEVNALCLACHSATAPIPTQPPKLFGREVDEAVARLMQPGVRIALDPLQRRGHPVVGHPVRGPKDPLVPDRPFSCLSCHTPHGSDQRALGRFEHLEGSEVCVKCHT